MATVPRLRNKEGLSNQIGGKVKARMKDLKLRNRHICGRIALETSGAWIPNDVDITNIIHGRRTVLTTELVVLAKALECRAAYLLDEE